MGVPALVRVPLTRASAVFALAASIAVTGCNWQSEPVFYAFAVWNYSPDHYVVRMTDINVAVSGGSPVLLT